MKSPSVKRRTAGSGQAAKDIEKRITAKDNQKGFDQKLSASLSPSLGLEATRDSQRKEALLRKVYIDVLSTISAYPGVKSIEEQLNSYLIDVTPMFLDFDKQIYEFNIIFSNIAVLAKINDGTGLGEDRKEKLFFSLREWLYKLRGDFLKEIGIFAGYPQTETNKSFSVLDTEFHIAAIAAAAPIEMREAAKEALRAVLKASQEKNMHTISMLIAQAMPRPIQPNAKPAGTALPVSPSRRHVADLSPDELEARREIERKRSATRRARAREQKLNQ